MADLAFYEKALLIGLSQNDRLTKVKKSGKS